jgi:hypothetical protein
MDDDQNDDYNTRANDMTRISASKTDDIEEAPHPSGPADPAATSDAPEPKTDGWDNISTSETYEDDLDNDNDAVDPFSNEATDDPTEELGVSPEEYKDEMDKIALDELEHDHEDSREALEDADEADDNSASNA